ncbi:MAG TPA: selenocysteine-specific translation elongation factor [Firmicutes bacterium]|nr:selenocysteine-specific translation elongation factor [Bacillota bacterium]
MGLKHVIIGTAGHIDHGKSTLIKAITNIETDRLKEEKARGITIELGFAYFDLPSGRRAGIIDVPGHEKFIKNMLAGAGGIDVVVLVVAADEGMMPQTIEHLNILSLLQTQKGIVAVTKIDMVEPEWLELVLDDIASQLEGTFLEDADIIPVSSVTKQGIPELVAKIDELTAEVASRDDHLPFRYPIDRVFSMTGFGTIVTGTLISGQVQVGDKVEVYPQNIETRVRSLQVHGQKVDTAFAGQRVAMNLAGVQVSDLARGDVLAAPGLLRTSLMLDVRLELLTNAEKPLANRERLRLYTGTSEILCRAVLLDAEFMLPGEKALVQLRLEEPIAVQTGDRFVVRTYSPMYTIGGGAILDAHPKKRRRFRAEGIRELELRESGGDLQILNQTLLTHSEEFPTEAELFQLAGRPTEQLAEALETLQEEDLALSLVIDNVVYFLHSEYLQKLADKAKHVVSEYQRRFPLRPGMSKEELRSRVSRQASSKLFNSLVTLLAGEAGLVVRGGIVAEQDWQVRFTGIYAKMRERVLARLQEAPYAPPDIDELANDLNETPERLAEVLAAMSSLGEIVRVTPELAFLTSTVSEVRERVVAIIKEQGNITLADLRNELGTSRKFALPLLEYLDAQKITKRAGDARVLHAQYS